MHPSTSSKQPVRPPQEFVMAETPPPSGRPARASTLWLGRWAGHSRILGPILLLGILLGVGAAATAGDGEDQESAASGSLFHPSANAWPVFRGNLLGTGVAATTLPEDPKLLWTFDTESEIESTAAIVDGVVFFGDYEGRVYAVTLDEGKELWRFDAGTPIKAPLSVFDGVVYIGDEYGLIHALDAGSGEEKWQFETLGEIYAGVSLHGDRLLVGSYDNSLYCLDRDSGEKLWQVETEGYVHGTPAVADGLTTVSGCDGFMWLIDIETGETIHKINLRGQAASSPAVIGEMAYVATYENEVLGIDLERREVAWAYEHEVRKFPFYASAAADDEIVVIGGRDKIVHALDPRTGERKWEWNSGARLDSSPVIVGDRVFLGSKRGPVLALDKATGEPVWEFDTGSAIMASPAVASERLVIGSLDGILYCFG